MKERHRGKGASFRIPDPSAALTELESALQRAMSDSREEAAFFRALLEATIYAHVPLSNDSGRLRFIQFIRPDNGETVLPFFTDATKAEAVGRTDARIVAVKGSDFLEITHGATLMLNPNDAFCVLYPEEVAALLATGELPPIRNELLQSDRTIGVRLPISAPNWFQPCLLQVLSALPYIQQAYLVEMVPPENPSQVTLLISLGVEAALADRAVRAVTAGMQFRHRNLKVGVDMTTYDPAGEPPEWVTTLALEPIYDRILPANTTHGES